MNIEKENTMRALNGKPLFAQKQWRCALYMHTWLPWKDPILSRKGFYEYTEQYKSCGYCNYTQHRVISKKLL